MVELSEMLPSVDLVRRLVGLNQTVLNDDERLEAIAGWERVLSWATAEQNDLLAEIGADCDGLDARWYCEQVGLALGVTGGSAQWRMSQAVTLVESLPQVTAALRVGGITSHHARVAATRTRVLDREIARAVDEAVMKDPDWRTPSQLEKAFRQAILELDPEGAARRHEAARRDRRVSVRDEPDGMCSFYASLSAEHGQLVYATIDAHARSSKATNTPGDLRTLDQRRADALVELVTRGPDTPAEHGPTLHGRRPEIHVTVAWSTLIGLDDAPADLTGYGPIDATTARRISHDTNSVWRRLLVDPESGRLLDYGRSTYRPPRDVQDFVIARDVYCRFPNCSKPASMCDLDHRDDWNDGGTTSTEQIDPACRNHHRLKHEAGWTHLRDPDTGTSTWTDPTGRRHEKPATRLPTPPPVEPPVPALLDDADLGDPPF